MTSGGLAVHQRQSRDFFRGDGRLRSCLGGVDGRIEGSRGVDGKCGVGWVTHRNLLGGTVIYHLYRRVAPSVAQRAEVGNDGDGECNYHTTSEPEIADHSPTRAGRVFPFGRLAIEARGALPAARRAGIRARGARDVMKV